MSFKSSPTLVTVMGGFAKDNVLTPAAQNWISALRAISSKLVLVFDQDHLDPKPECSQDVDHVEIVVERHGAYDFGSYRRGLDLADRRGWLDGASHVLLCNDSMIGPFWDLQDFVGPMLKSGEQLWGVTDSSMYRPHLQSYFLLMGRQIFMHSAIMDFFREVRPQPSRHDVIQCYELGFSKLICQLGFSWKVFLAAEKMHDPRNGEPMGNITAYPICMLQKGVPLIKVKSLIDPRSNYDDLDQTCSYISRHFPELWKMLWDESKHQSLWQSVVRVGIILDEGDVPHLANRVDWIKSHPHPTLKAIISVRKSSIDTRVSLVKDFEKEIKDGVLSILIIDDWSDTRSSLIKMVVGIGMEWVVFAQSDLWSYPGTLQTQIRRLAEKPSREFLDGTPSLWSLNYCLSEQGMQQIMGWQQSDTF